MNASKTAITPAAIYNPFAESGANSAVPFTCDAAGNPTVIKGYSLNNCAFTPNLTFAVDNCLDTRSKTDNSANYDIRIDHHIGKNDTIFGRAYMMWDTDTGIVAGTNSVSPNPYHVWNMASS